MEKLTNYEPHTDSRKSFYGKAQEMIRENGDRLLFSYGTPILKITADDKLYLTKYYKYSLTTLRHAVDFVKHYKKSFLNAKSYTMAEFLEINGNIVENRDRLNNGELLGF